MIIQGVADIDITYPPKPVYKPSSSWVIKSIISIILYITAFYIFLDSSINLILIVVVVLLIHEMGHLLAMKYFKYADIKLFFIPLLGALVTGKKEVYSQRQRAIILLAGPVPGILIGLIIYVLGQSHNSSLLIDAGNIFVFLNVFNLLPLTPMDGGSLIETLFFSSRELLQKIFLFISATGLILLSFFFGSMILLIVPFLLLMQIPQRAKLKRIKNVLDKNSINYKKKYSDLTDEEYWLIREQIILFNEASFKGINPKVHKFSEKEDFIIKQVEGLGTNPMLLDLSSVGKFLFTIIWLLFLIAPIIILVIMEYYHFIYLKGIH
jgi:stage IV sporulation protein FB